MIRALMSWPVLILLVVLVCFITGCQTIPPEPEVRTVVRTVTNTVNVPVAVPCFTEAERPKPPTPTPINLETATPDQVAAANAADLKAMDLYAQLVDALFLKCLKGTS